MGSPLAYPKTGRVNSSETEYFPAEQGHGRTGARLTIKHLIFIHQTVSVP